MCRLSIVVPCLNDTDDFENTLVSVLENRPSQCEVLVVHFEPYDDPYDLGSEVRFVEAPENGLISAVNAGVRSARGRVLHILRPSVLVADGWTDAVMDWFKDDRIGAVAPLMLQAEDADRIASAGLTFSIGGRRIVNGFNISTRKSRRVFRRPIVGPAIESSFYRRTVIEALGGFDSQLGPRLADVDLGMSMKKIGQRTVLEPDCVLTGPRALCESPAPSLRSGRYHERLFCRHASEVGWARALPAHAFHVMGSVLKNAMRSGGYTQLVGRLLGACELGSRHHYRCRIADAAEEFAALSQELDQADRYAVEDYRNTAPGESRSIDRAA